jgi:hypothetical protein
MKKKPVDSARGLVIEAEVPAGMTAGEQFTILVPDGRHVSVVVPAGKAAGTKIQVEVPPAPPPIFIEVVIPEGMESGGHIPVLLPDGRQVSVVVPAGNAAGAKIQFAVPSAGPSAALTPASSAPSPAPAAVPAPKQRVSIAVEEEIKNPMAIGANLGAELLKKNSLNAKNEKEEIAVSPIPQAIQRDEINIGGNLKPLRKAGLCEAPVCTVTSHEGCTGSAMTACCGNICLGGLCYPFGPYVAFACPFMDFGMGGSWVWHPRAVARYPGAINHRMVTFDGSSDGVEEAEGETDTTPSNELLSDFNDICEHLDVDLSEQAMSWEKIEVTGYSAYPTHIRCADCLAASVAPLRVLLDVLKPVLQPISDSLLESECACIAPLFNPDVLCAPVVSRKFTNLSYS